MANLFADLPESLPEELTEVLIQNHRLRIERIVSTGQTSPRDFWYDQDEHEWVVVLRGRAQLTFEKGRRVQLAAGDYLLIPAHQRHRVTSTSPDEPTVWLAVFFRD